MSYKRYKKKGFKRTFAPRNPITKEEVLSLVVDQTAIEEVEVIDFLEPQVLRWVVKVPICVLDKNNKLNVTYAYLKRTWLKSGIPLASTIGKILLKYNAKSIIDLKNKKVQAIRQGDDVLII